MYSFSISRHECFLLVYVVVAQISIPSLRRHLAPKVIAVLRAPPDIGGGMQASTNHGAQIGQGMSHDATNWNATEELTRVYVPVLIASQAWRSPLPPGAQNQGHCPQQSDQAALFESHLAGLCSHGSLPVSSLEWMSRSLCGHF